MQLDPPAGSVDGQLPLPDVLPEPEPDVEPVDEVLAVALLELAVPDEPEPVAVLLEALDALVVPALELLALVAVLVEDPVLLDALDPAAPVDDACEPVLLDDDAEELEVPATVPLPCVPLLDEPPTLPVAGVPLQATSEEKRIETEAKRVTVMLREYSRVASCRRGACASTILGTRGDASSIPRMPCIAIQIVRFVDTNQPGFVECSLRDAAGREHFFVEKSFTPGADIRTRHGLQRQDGPPHGPCW